MSESVVTKLVSPSAQEAANAVFDFVIDETHNGLCLVKLSPNDPVPLHFDAVYVIAIPLEKAKMVAVTDRLMHSVVILVQRATGFGHMLEYTNSNEVRMSQAGRLAKKQGFLSNHRPFHTVGSGFRSCKISLEKLLEFNRRFQSLSDYHVFNHNCHIYHRSLLATAVNGRLMYNLSMGSTALWRGNSGSNLWVDFPQDASSCRQDLIDSDNKTRESLKVRLVESGPVCTVVTIAFNPDRHRKSVISAAGMELSVQDMQTLRDAITQREEADRRERERLDREAAAQEAVRLAEETARRERARIAAIRLAEAAAAAEAVRRDKELAAARAKQASRENIQLGGVITVISLLLTVTAVL